MMQNFIKFSLIGIYIICTLSKFEKAYAAYGLPIVAITWDKIVGAPDTSKILYWQDTTTRIATKNDMDNGLAAMVDTVGSIRISMFSMVGEFLKWTDTTNKIGTHYGLILRSLETRDSIAAVRADLGPVAFTNNYNDLSSKPTLFSGAYSDLTGKPVFATVATSGSYNDLTNKPAADTTNKILYYNSSGRVNQIVKKWVGIVTPTVATDQTISISSAGFSTILSSRVDAIYNGNLIWCQVNSVTTSTITLDLYRPSTSLVTVLGLSVLQGVPVLTGNDLSNIRLQIEITGY